MISEKLTNYILQSLSDIYGKIPQIQSIKTLGGGSINNTLLIKTNIDNFFVKWNDAKLYPKMFEKEAAGLKLLTEANEIHVPGVILFDETEAHSFLILNYVNSSSPKKDFWEDFGKKLAKLHKHSNDLFGLDHDNYIGSLYQSNKKHSDWNSFFILERLEKQIKLAKDKQNIDNITIKHFETLYKFLPEIFPKEKPSLLHGDLWSGNYMATENGDACIFDPAVYYGSREMDIAMSKLFGGFDPEFYHSYNEEFALIKGWKERVDICNLYPLMVHVNLFGGGYLESVKNIIKKY
jgi:protein-ribulosamine 3-kinase